MKRQPLIDWLRGAFGTPGQVTDDIHFDQLAGPWSDAGDGLEWATYGCEALKEVTHAMRTCLNLAGVQKAVVALPLDVSKHIRLWKLSFWRMAGAQMEPPSLILMKDGRFDIRYDEEYFRRLELPGGDNPDLSAVFRSQRGFDCQGAVSEFSNVIFLVASF